MSDLVRTNLTDGIFVVTIDHPKANALSLEMVKLLLGAFKEAAQQRLARVVLIRAEGDDFSAGQDIYEMLKAEGVSYRTAHARDLQSADFTAPPVGNPCAG